MREDSCAGVYRYHLRLLAACIALVLLPLFLATIFHSSVHYNSLVRNTPSITPTATATRLKVKDRLGHKNVNGLMSMAGPIVGNVVSTATGSAIAPSFSVGNAARTIKGGPELPGAPPGAFAAPGLATRRGGGGGQYRYLPCYLIVSVGAAVIGMCL